MPPDPSRMEFVSAPSRPSKTSGEQPARALEA